MSGDSNARRFMTIGCVEKFGASKTKTHRFFTFFDFRSQDRLKITMKKGFGREAQLT